MAGLHDMIYTESGENLLADIIAKEATLDITKIVVGKGYVPEGKNIAQMEAIVDPVVELPIKKKEKTEERSEIIIGTEFNNVTVQEGFHYRELGVYAKGVYPDGSESEETLYIYGNSGDSAEYIPAHSGSVVVEKRIDVIVYVGGKTNVSLEVAEAFYTTKEELAEAVQKLESETVPITQKGEAGGVAELDDNGKVPSAQLPSYVDDVLEYDTAAAFPATGESGKIYVDTTTNLTYRWSGSGYVEISKSLALGETASTAFRGDRGKQAYDNAAQAVERLNGIINETTIQVAQETGFLSEHGDVGEMLNKILQEAMRAEKRHETNKANPHAVTKAQVGLGNVDNTSDAAKPISTATQTALNGKAASSHNHSAANITSGTLPLTRGGTGQTTLAGLKSALGVHAASSSGGWTYAKFSNDFAIAFYTKYQSFSFPSTMTGGRWGNVRIPASPLTAVYGGCASIFNGTSSITANFTSATELYYSWASSETSVSGTLGVLLFGMME
jgi:hypothetical protein